MELTLRMPLGLVNLLSQEPSSEPQTTEKDWCLFSQFSNSRCVATMVPDAWDRSEFTAYNTLEH